MSSTNLYSRFHDWRARLYQQLADMETDFLTALRSDLAQTLERINAEIARRETTQRTTPRKGNAHE